MYVTLLLLNGAPRNILINSSDPKPLNPYGVWLGFKVSGCRMLKLDSRITKPRTVSPES